MSHRAAAARLVASVGVGWLLVWLAARVLPVSVASAGGRTTLLVALALWAPLLLAWAWWGHRRGRNPERVARTIVAGTSVLLAGSATLAMHGTAWGYNALWSDASFRTEAATRYADSWRLADYAYAGTPPYYPPLLAWLQGRAAALLDVPAWTVMKPSQVLVAALVPLLAWCFWRRLVAPVPAALVVAAGALLTAHPLKSDEWLVLMCAVPWWLDLVRGVRLDGVRRWPWWGHGLVAGLILLTHTFYLLPLAVATVVGWLVDLVRRRRPELGPRRVVGVVVVGLVVAAPYWVPQVLARLGGASTDSFQLRYAFPGGNVPPWPLPLDVPGTLGLVGVGWLAWSAREWRRGRPDALAGAVALAWVAAYLTMLAGAVGERLDVGLLAFKAGELVIVVMAVSGVCGLVTAGRALVVRAPAVGAGSRALPAVFASVVLVLAGAVAVDHAGHNVVGRSVLAAQSTAYPDGSRPSGGRELPVGVDGPAFSGAGDPSTQEVRDAWEGLTGAPMGSGTVLVTTRVDLLATTPVHPYVTWKSIYSNPLGGFESRLAVLEEVAACPDSACARSLLVDNPYDRVDGLVLERRGDDLVMPVLVDDFPDRSRTTEVVVPARLVQGGGFATVDVGPVAVVAVR